MKYCSSCGQELLDAAIFCPKCGCACGGLRGVDPYDAPSAGMTVLGFFIPIVGFILYLVEKDTRPLHAASAGKGALGGFLTGLGLWFLYIIFAAIYASSFAAYFASSLYF